MRWLFPLRYLPVLLSAAALLAGPPLVAQPALTGPEFYVLPPMATQSVIVITRVAAATDAGGRPMVIWIDEHRPWQPQLHGLVLDASGRPVRPAVTFATGVHALVDATLAPAAPEGFLLAWQTSERTGGNALRYRLRVRRLSPSGRPQGSVIPVRDLVTAASPPMSLQTASASDGSFVAVWSAPDPHTSRDDVFLRRFDAAGQPLGKAAPLPGKMGNERRYSPSLTVLDDGEIRIAWRSNSSDISPAALWVRRFDRNGAPLAAPVQLVPESADALIPAVTFGPDGGLLATWRSADDVLHLRAYAPDLTPFSEHQATMSWWSQVAAERGGTFLIFDAGLFPCAVAGLQLEADGTPRGPVGCLTRPSPGQRGGSSVTETADGGFMLFWTESRRNGQDDVQQLFGQRLATAAPGTLQIESARSVVPESAPHPLELRILRRNGNSGTVSVDYRLTGAASGNGTVTFPDGDSTPRVVSIPVSDDGIPGNDRIVRVALLRPAGGAVLGLPRRAVVEVRDDDEPSPLLAHAEPLIEVAYGDGRDTNLWGPDLAASPRGDFEVAWSYSFRHRYTEPVRYDFAVQGQRFDTAGEASTIFDQSCSAPAERVRLAMHQAGNFMALWREASRTGTWTGFAQLFDALGAASGPIVSLKFLPDSAAPLPMGRFVAVGLDTAREGLFAHFLSTRGIDRRSPVLVTHEALEPGSAAAVAADGIGRSVVVWSVAPTGNGPAGIFARRFNVLGAPLGPAFRVSQWEGHDVALSVATDAHGNFVVAWQRSWDGDGTGIYARAFDAAGAPLSDEIPVNSTTEGNQEAPSVALTGDGRFAVLWQSPYEENYSVFSRAAGQLFAADGTRLGSEAEIALEAEAPVIAWSDQGFVIAYSSNSDILARRLPL